MLSACSCLQVGDWGRGPGQQGHDNQTAVAQLMGKVAAAQPVEFIVSTGALCACVERSMRVATRRHSSGTGLARSSEHSACGRSTAVPRCCHPTRMHAAALLPPHPHARMLPPCCHPTRIHAATLLPPPHARAAGDNFYPNGLTSYNDSAFKDTFTNVYTDKSLQVHGGRRVRGAEGTGEGW